MITILSLLISAVFLFVSGIHFYWLFGGKWGVQQALPSNAQGEKVLKPKKIDTAIVAVIFLAIAIYYAIIANIISIALPLWMHQYGGWAMCTIFLLRAIGEFRYVGFFKKVKGTPFAIADTKYFSPLCLILAIFSLLIQVFNGN
ncbi:MAG: DUF3995 domain-containing protein [Bacteroidetes bacterium]|nr:DUF3995 domain-containing protein [Bacteroidota bacterium]